MEPFEDLRQVLRRRMVGREEALQLVMTCLIIGGPYPRWGTRSTPTAGGQEFLAQSGELSFGERPERAEVFVDEFELPRRHAEESAGWPDWAVVWRDRLWIIELKTETASHRPTQLPHYLELAAYHHSGLLVDLTYITGPLDKSAPPLTAGQRYAHLAWDDVLPLARNVWTDNPDPKVRAYLDVAGELVESIGTPWMAWRWDWLDLVPETVEVEPELAWLIEKTAADGEQRALDLVAGSGEQLEDLRD